MRYFTFTINTLTYTFVPVGLAHFTHFASIVRDRNTLRSLVRGRGTSVLGLQIAQQNQIVHKKLKTNYLVNKKSKEISCV